MLVRAGVRVRRSLSRSFASSEWKPKDISEAMYHRIADQALDAVQDAVEDGAISEDNLPEIDSAEGVLNITFPGPKTFVLNKQTPNRQLWLSSPIRFGLHFESPHGLVALQGLTSNKIKVLGSTRDVDLS